MREGCVTYFVLDKKKKLGGISVNGVHGNTRLDPYLVLSQIEMVDATIL